jgi:hypothetical protein
MENPMANRAECACAEDGFAITASDTTVFTVPAEALWVGTGGDVNIVTPRGSIILLKNVADGTVVPVKAKQVKSTSTTASDLIGLTY